MIVKMRKMDLLLYHREREKFLEELRGLGVVHITSEQPVETAAAQGLAAEVQRAHRIASALKKIVKEKKVSAPFAPAAQSSDVPEILARFEECESKRDRVEQELAAIAKDRAALAPWGNFDPQSVRRLADVGVSVKFYDAPRKKYDALDKSALAIKEISAADGLVYFAVVYRGDAPELPGAEEVRLPDTSVAELFRRAQALSDERKEVEAEIYKLEAYIPVIERYKSEQLNGLKFEEARGSMTGEADGKLLKLSGWVPKKDEARVVSFLNNFPAYAAFRDPLEDENVPVKLKNGKFNSMFEPVVGLYSLPGYREIDVIPFVAPFFTVFYGLCLADVGYGALITLIGLVALFKVGPKARPLMALGVVLGISTMAAGVLMNGFFGQPLAAFERFAVLASSENESGAVYPAMGLSFVAAFLQLFLGMGLQAYMQMRDRGFAAGLQPISSILMASGIVILGAKAGVVSGIDFGGFAVGDFAIGPTLAAIGNYPLGTLAFGIGEILLFGGLAILLLFNSLDKIIFMRPLTGLWALYNFATGLLSNILSYMRLFALGLAGGLLGAAVNQIAFMFVATDVPGVHNFASIGMVATALILLFGHALNFGLSGLGAFIHPLRLTFVEFYGAMGFNGGGKPYTPFAKVER